MINDIAKVLLTEEEIQKRVKEMGAQLAKDYEDKNPVMICILKGSVMFYTDLLRAMNNIRLSMDFMAASSYGNRTSSSGELCISKDLSNPIENKHVVIVEDIIDSGFTLSRLSELLKNRGAKSLRIVTLLDKPERRAPGITLKSDYSGFTIGDEFVVGYGLDYAEQYRSLPFIGVLKPEVYEKI